MCGLICMISKRFSGFQYKDKEMFDQMLYADALRGVDSTGVFGINEYGNAKIVKAAQHAFDFMATKTYGDFHDSIFNKFRIVVGHNRAATRGILVDNNAHPFVEDHICLVHNGTLKSHSHLAKVDVDSHAICKSIAKRGYKKTIPDLDGAFALIWYNAKEKKLYITRNKERPLWMLETKDTLYIASESEMLEWLYKRNFGGVVPKSVYFAEDKIYTWELGQKDELFTVEDSPPKKAPPKPVFTTMTTAPVPTVLGEAHNKGAGGKTGDGNNKSYVYGDKVIFEHESNSVVGNRIYLRGLVYNNHSQRVSTVISTEGMSTDDIDYILDFADMFEGIVSGFSNKAGETTLILRDVKPKEIFTTIDDVLVFEEDVAAAGYCCHSCGSIIDIDDQNGQFWARFKDGKIKKLLCRDCVEKIPQLMEKCSCTTNESSSSHTLMEVDQPLDYEDYYLPEQSNLSC